MSDRKWGRAGAWPRGRLAGAMQARAWRRWRARQLLAASLGAIAAVTLAAEPRRPDPPGRLGPASPQTYTVTSSNPDVVATVAQGKFLTIGVSHASSGASDPAFTGSLTFQLFDDLTPMTTSEIEKLVNAAASTPAHDHQRHPARTRTSTGSSTTSPAPPTSPSRAARPTATARATRPPARSPSPTSSSSSSPSPAPGQLAMANTGQPDTNSSQFFITTGSPRFADFKYTIFGQLVAGSDHPDQDDPGRQDGPEHLEHRGLQAGHPDPLHLDDPLDTNPNGVIHVDTTHATAGETVQRHGHGDGPDAPAPPPPRRSPSTSRPMPPHDRAGRPRAH